VLGSQVVEGNYLGHLQAGGCLKLQLLQEEQDLKQVFVSLSLPHLHLKWIQVKTYASCQHHRCLYFWVLRQTAVYFLMILALKCEN